MESYKFKKQHNRHYLLYEYCRGSILIHLYTSTVKVHPWFKRFKNGNYERFDKLNSRRHPTLNKVLLKEIIELNQRLKIATFH